MEKNMNRPCDAVKARMAMADFTARRDMIRIGFDAHTLLRSVQRYYRFMDKGLLAENILDLLNEVPDLEDRLLDNLLPNETFVITRERDGLTVFAAYDYETVDADHDGALLIFVKTVLVANEGQRVWVDDSDKLLLKICADDSIQEDPVELRRGKIAK